MPLTVKELLTILLMIDIFLYMKQESNGSIGAAAFKSKGKY